MKNIKVAIIGAGLAGSEAALTLARNGILVDLFEMRPCKMTPAHRTELPAELVCSNSLKSMVLPTAHALLKEELSYLSSPLLAVAKECRVPAGTALAVDRDVFSKKISKIINDNHLIRVITEEVSEPPKGYDAVVIASGPLTSDSLADWIQKRFNQDSFNFYDAIAPIVSADSIDLTKAFYSSRWDKGEADYCNCPFSKDEFETFYDALIEADRVKARDFEDENFFEGCLPIEVVAQRGFKALTFGTMRPVGITDPRTGRWPYAVCQLRKENASGTALNLVGFQTRMTYAEQNKVLRLIPGLANAEFLRFGSIHRNSYINSPKLLNFDLSFIEEPNIYVAGQLCGNEGYTESIATGQYVATRIFERFVINRSGEKLSADTALGALVRYITESDSKNFTPSGVNFGLFDQLPVFNGKRKIGKAEKKTLIVERALLAMKMWINTLE